MVNIDGVYTDVKWYLEKVLWLAELCKYKGGVVFFTPVRFADTP